MDFNQIFEIVNKVGMPIAALLGVVWFLLKKDKEYAQDRANGLGQFAQALEKMSESIDSMNNLTTTLTEEFKILIVVERDRANRCKDNIEADLSRAVNSIERMQRNMNSLEQKNDIIGTDVKDLKTAVLSGNFK